MSKPKMRRKIFRRPALHTFYIAIAYVAECCPKRIMAASVDTALRLARRRGQP